MNHIFKSQTCIIIENLEEIDDLILNNIDLKICWFFCTNFNHSIHYNFSTKYKIEYSDKKSLYQFIHENNIDSLIYSNLNLTTISHAGFVSDTIKNKIISISFFSKKSYEYIYSKNFYQTEKGDNEYWKWNFGSSMMSELEIINYFPFKSNYSCNIRWPFLKTKKFNDNNNPELNRLYDNENNILENIENKDLYYSCNGFSKKIISFFFEKKESYDLDPRNLNFSLHNLKFDKYDLETNSLDKKNIYNKLINNLYNKIQIFSLNNIIDPITEITTYRGVDNFNLKTIEKSRFKTIEENRLTAKNNLIIFSSK